MATNTPKMKLYKAKFDNPNSDPVDVLRDLNLNLDILDDNATMGTRSAGVLPPVSEAYTGRNIYWPTTGQTQIYDPSHVIDTDWWEGSNNAQHLFLRNLEASDLSVPNAATKVIRFSAVGGDQIPPVSPYGLSTNANRDHITFNMVGFYMVGANVRWTNPGAVADVEYFTALVYKNSFGTIVRQWAQGRPTDDLPNTCCMTGGLKIGPGDLGSRIEANVFQASGSSKTLHNLGPQYNNLWAVRLGFNGNQVI